MCFSSRTDDNYMSKALLLSNLLPQLDRKSLYFTSSIFSVIMHDCGVQVTVQANVMWVLLQYQWLKCRFVNHNGKLWYMDAV